MFTIQKVGNRIKQRVFFIATCLLVIAGACKKDHSSSDQQPSSLSFSYSGDTSGTFSADGDYPEPPPDNGDIFYEWVKAERFKRPIDLFNSEALIRITANVPKSQNTAVSNFINLTLPDKFTDIYSVGNGSNGAEINLGGHSFSFTEGTINVTYNKNGRIKGSFEGRATYYGNPNEAINVTNGAFDVKIN